MFHNECSFILKTKGCAVSLKFNFYIWDYAQVYGGGKKRERKWSWLRHSSRAPLPGCRRLPPTIPSLRFEMGPRDWDEEKKQSIILQRRTNSHFHLSSFSLWNFMARDHRQRDRHREWRRRRRKKGVVQQSKSTQKGCRPWLWEMKQEKGPDLIDLRWPLCGWFFGIGGRNVIFELNGHITLIFRCTLGLIWVSF